MKAWGIKKIFHTEDEQGQGFAVKRWRPEHFIGASVQRPHLWNAPRVLGMEPLSTPHIQTYDDPGHEGGEGAHGYPAEPRQLGGASPGGDLNALGVDERGEYPAPPPLAEHPESGQAPAAMPEDRYGEIPDAALVPDDPQAAHDAMPEENQDSAEANPAYILPPAAHETDEAAETLRERSAAEEAQQVERERLRQEAYDEGYRAGHAAGYSNGQAQGKEEGYRSGEREGQAAGRVEGHKAGYEEGHLMGLEKGRTQAEAEVAQLRAVLDQLGASVESYEAAMAPPIAQLAYTVAERIVGEALRQEPERLCTVIRAALRELPALQLPVRVIVHPDDQRLIEMWLKEDPARLGWQIEPSLEMSRGGCHLLSARTEVDLSLETRWKQVLDRMMLTHTA